MQSIGTPSDYYIVVRIRDTENKSRDRQDEKRYFPTKRTRDKEFKTLVKSVYPLNPNGEFFSVKKNN